MGQTPLDLLKQLAMRGVPTAPRASTPMEQENQDFRATALQAEQPTWKKVSRNALEALGGVFADPFADDPARSKKLTSGSWGKDLGMLAAAAPMSMGSLKRLPVVAPEAYTDVKAGGLRLYSRLTDSFAKAPKQMNPDKIRSVAKQGASMEEINLRKLEDFLAGRQPMEKVAREDVMKHLAANPLELDVVRKGQTKVPIHDEVSHRSDMAAFRHELDTEYGGDWNLENITPEQRRRWQELEARGEELVQPSSGLEGLDSNRTKWGFLQTPGPKENYGESLINLPVPQQGTSEELKDLFYKRYAKPFTGTEQELQDFNNILANEAGQVFSSSHWDEPNNLVWSRHNDRRLGPTLSENQVNDLYEAERARAGKVEPSIEELAGYPKGRFIEEIQSDWHQQGRERGYKPAGGFTELPEGYELRKFGEFDDLRDIWKDSPEELEKWGVYNPNRPGFIGRIAGHDTPEEAVQSGLEAINASRPPDAPYKDTYHELALKQQLLDTANDPSLEWLGVADADTVSAMEGHTNIRPGTELYYNEKHPSALEKLLKPYGGDVQYDLLPGQQLSASGEKGVMVDSIPVAHPLTKFDGIGDHHNYGRVATDIMNEMKQRPQLPGPGFWKANLTPEMKKAIAERGFPAMAALLALQAQQRRFNGEEQ
jgi:hypothetical protein